MLSAVISVKDMAGLLPRALASLTADEVIVVDDASSDGSAEVAERLGARVVRIEGGTVAHGRNAGVAAARGEYVGFLDADDEWIAPAPDPRLVALEADPELDVALGLVELVDAGGTRLADPAEIWAMCAIVRRFALEAVGAFDTTLDGDDLDWLLRARELGLAITCVPEPVYRYYRHPGAMTADASRGQRAVIDALRRRVVRARG